MKRVISVAILLCMGVFSAGASALPAGKVVIKDPVGDANGINDQGLGDGSFGDHVTPADASSVTDLMEVKIANDAKNVYVTFVTEAAPPATQGVGYRLSTLNTAVHDETRCLNFVARYPGAGNDLTEPTGYLQDACAAKFVNAKVVGQTIIVARKSHKALGRGKVIKAPMATGYVYLGTAGPGVGGPVLDTTKVGKNYKLVDKKKR